MIEKIKNSVHPVVILAAGLSQRMGSFKPLLKYNEQNTFISHLIYEFNKIEPSQIIIVTNESVFNILGGWEINNVKILINKNPAEGRLSSIKIGIDALENKTACFLHNVDNPFVNPALLERMADMVKVSNYVVPVHNGKGGHPILLGSNAIKLISSHENTETDLREILKVIQKKMIPSEDDRILVNINTQDDYDKFSGFFL